MTKTLTKIEKQAKKKTNPELVETIRLAKKNAKYKVVAEILTGSRKDKVTMNLERINRLGKDVIIPGKVLSQGEINKKIKVVALNFSEKAREKLLKAGCEVNTITEEIKKNPDGKGLEVMK